MAFKAAILFFAVLAGKSITEKSQLTKSSVGSSSGRFPALVAAVGVNIRFGCEKFTTLRIAALFLHVLISSIAI